MRTLSISEIAALTGIDRRTAAKRVEHLPSSPGPKGARLLDSAPALRAIFSGPDSGLDPAQERAALDRIRRMGAEVALQEKCGALISVASYEEALSEYARQVIMTLDTLPDLLEKDAGIDGRAVERCQRVIDGLRQELADRLVAAAEKRMEAEARERTQQQ